MLGDDVEAGWSFGGVFVASGTRGGQRVESPLAFIRVRFDNPRHPMTHRLPILALLTIAACAGTLATPSSDTSRGLLGEWTVEFRLDSVRSTGSWRPASFATTRGTLRLIDSLSDQPRVYRSAIQLSFDTLLGRPMSCFDPRPTTTVVDRSGSQVMLRFTPNGADCGFGASGSMAGDSIIGTWDESGFAGPQVMGRFRMVRLK